jgi:hypothetical protein
MKSGIQIAGVSSQIRKGIIKGMDKWIKSHHLKVNFRYLTRHLPKKMLIIKATADTVIIFMSQRYASFRYSGNKIDKHSIFFDKNI